MERIFEQSTFEFDPMGTAGFYAIAYNWNGETIISYRGTNFDPGGSVEDFLDSPLLKDAWNGWTLALGFNASQP